MPRRPDARTLLFEKIRNSPARFVHVTGVPYAAEREANEDPEKLDHIWLTLEAPPFGRLRASLNTVSLRAIESGLDGKIRVGIVKSTWTEKPPPGLVEDPGQDYAKIDAAFKVTYHPIEREALAAMLMERAKRAVRVEVWGELHAKEFLGVRQIHGRRRSDAVKDDLRNRDGALKFYYPEENLAELFLFKFAGQP
jgi:hypothetical protein